MSGGREADSAVREIEHCRIALGDGTALAARLWIPEGAEQEPVPAIFEFIPYRKRDFYRDVDEAIHPYFARHGFAVVRADLRGSGESDGILLDEYLAREQDDAIEIIAWIAAQPWCSGAVGMMGISWGGFNALQVAARRPPALKAIITVASTDDRYADDVHYMGGCLLGDNFAWAAQMLVRNARPPDPALVGEEWRDIWLHRLDATPPFIAAWLSHQRRDGFWRHGSVCEDYTAITAAVWAIGGWADGYANAVPRLVEGLGSPVRGLVGPWPHDYPHRATPGPRLGFLQMAVEWWERWLKGTPNAVDEWPRYAAYIQSSVPPRNFYGQRGGRWVAEPGWPSPRVHPRIFALAAGGMLVEGRAAAGAVIVASPLTTGLGCRRWCPYGVGPEMASDQRSDDARSAVFETPALDRPIEVLGAPEVVLDLAADRPVAMIAARHVDVPPDGAATLVTYGLFNLCHHLGHDRVRRLVPGEPVKVTVRLNHVGYAFPPGHKIRLSLSSNYWPIAWPSPEFVKLSLLTGGAHLIIPQHGGGSEDPAILFPPPLQLEPARHSVIRPGGYDRRIVEDMDRGETTVVATKDLGRRFIADADLECDGVARERYAIRSDDPLSAELEVTAIHALSRGNWHTQARTRSLARCTASQFIVDLEVDASENSRRIFSRCYRFDVPRDGV